MKNRISISTLFSLILILLISVTSVSCASSFDADNNKSDVQEIQFEYSEWKEQPNGLKVRLFTTKQNWQAGEDVEICLEIWNDSNDVIKMPAMPYMCINIFLNGNAIADQIGEYDEKSLETLAKDGKTEITLTYLRTDSASVNKPGIYMVTGSFGEIKLPEFSVKVR